MRSNRTGYNNHNNYRKTGNTYNRNTSGNIRNYARKSTNYSITENTPKRSYTRASMGNNSARSNSTAGSNNTANEYGYYGNSYYGYNDTSVAHDFYYETEAPVKKRRRKAVSPEKKEIQQLNMPKTIASIAVVFTLSLVLLCSYAVNSSYRVEIASKQAELAEIEEENQYLKTALEDNIDLDKIAKEAEKLGLQKPQAYQITEVEVPNESYTVQYDTQIATQDKSVWQFIKELFNK